MGKKSCDKKDQNKLLESYKIAINMADKISDRRALANNFFLTLNTAILAFSGIKAKTLVLFAGILVCIDWLLLLRNYQQLNQAKFEVINKLEKKLSLNIMSLEWDILQQNGYKTLSSREQIIPITFICVYSVWIFVEHQIFFFKISSLINSPLFLVNPFIRCDLT